jgi:hypothetical protein
VRRETKNHAVFFARTLVESLREDVALVRNPLRSAGFRVLRAHDVPSVLLELGYLTSAQDEKLLTDDEWQDRVAGTGCRRRAGLFRGTTCPRPVLRQPASVGLSHFRHAMPFKRMYMRGLIEDHGAI